MVEIRLMSRGEEPVVIDLVTSSFQHDVAALYSQEGVREFFSYANSSALQDRQARNHVVLLASQDEAIMGILELRDYCHISMLFVVPRYQRTGIGRLLVNEALQLIKINQPEIREVTVNSSPNAVRAYLRFGFRAAGELQIKNGIGFMPMTLPLDMKNGT